MGTAMSGRVGKARRARPAENGFSLLEVMISMVILSVGLVSLLGVFGLAMASTQGSQDNLIAKQLANEAYESIITARNTGLLTWDDIQNTGATTTCNVVGITPCGIFAGNSTLSAPQFEPICVASTSTTGHAGIIGTTDSITTGTPSTCSTSEQTLQDPGPDGIFNTADDTFISLNGYQRAIQIGPVYDANNNLIPTLRAVTITIQYTIPQMKTQQTYVLNSFISQYP
jgi:prepilin-type N-terminal cleavage/methylation domain-containing protein